MNSLHYLALVVFLWLVAVTGCTTNTVDKVQLNRISTVAIVAMDGYLEQPDPEGPVPQQVLLEVKRAMANYKGDPAITSKIYSILNQQLQQQLGWSILPIEQVAGNAKYRTVYDRYHVPMQPNYMKSLHLLGMEFDRLNYAERQQFFDYLKVDSILLFQMEVSPSRVTLSINEYSEVEYAAKITLRLYVRDLEQPVLRLENVRGPANEVKVKSWFGISLDQPIAAAIVTSVSAAIEKALAELPK